MCSSDPRMLTKMAALLRRTLVVFQGFAVTPALTPQEASKTSRLLLQRRLFRKERRREPQSNVNVFACLELATFQRAFHRQCALH